MRVFMTGATGYIGSAVVGELVDAGHEVAGLTRSSAKSGLLEDLGARPVVADLRDAGAYHREARAADGLIHLAAEESAARAEADGMAVDALLGAAGEGSASVLVYTSGCFVLGDTGDAPAHEDASTEGAPALVAWRPAHEDRVLAAGAPELATAVVRPGMVYGGGDGAFASLFATAEGGGEAEFVGDGANRWSPVYRGDVARLYRMLIERQGGGIFHCAEAAVPVRRLAMAASLAAGAGGATRALPVEEAREELGPFADALTLDQVVGCRRALEFGWAPEHPPFVDSADAVYGEWREARGR